MSRHAPVQPRRSSQPVLATAQLLIALDYSIVYVALPSIGAELTFDTAGLQWVIAAHALAFAGLLLLCGRLTDVLGARVLFLGGLGLIALASIGAGLADRPGLLIAMRAVQGGGAALLVPSTMALLADRGDRSWGLMGAVGLVTGALAGGLLTSVSWRLAFLAIAVIALVALLAAPDRLPRVPRLVTRLSLDVVGVVVGTGGVVALVLALSRCAEHGWGSPSVWPMAVLGLVLLGALAGWERLTAEPFLPGELLRVRSVRVGCVVAVLFMASVGAEFFLVTLYLQDVRGYDPVSVGLAFLPLVLAMILGNAVARRFRVLVMAFLCGAVGLVVLAVVAATDASLWTGVLPGLVIAGFGQGAAFTGLLVAGTAGLPAHRRELGAGLLITVQHAGGSIGIGVAVLLLGRADGFATAFALAAVLSGGAALAALRFPPVAPRGRHGGVGAPDQEVRR